MKHRITFLLGVSALLCALSPGLAQATEWTVPVDFVTIQEAINSPSVVTGDTILVAPGNYAGAFVTKAVEIKGTGGAVITSGPVHSSGLIQGFRILTGGDGATISHLRFEVDLAIMNAESADDVTVTQNTFISPIQGISNWSGSRWNITHNKIIDLRTRCGGGIGILVADFRGGDVFDNVVAHNKISGTLFVARDDCGGYNGTGIVLFADFRWNRLGAASIAWNRVVKNKVSLTLSDPRLPGVGDPIDVVAFELTEADDPEPLVHVIHDNAIGFNDFRGTVLQIALSLLSLDNPVNNISRNLGDNRGQGLHPKLFGPKCSSDDPCEP